MTDTAYRWHSSHWGTFRASMQDGRLDIQPFDADPAPSVLLGNIPAAIDHPARLGQPLIRRGWLEDGPGPDDRRGNDEFVAVDWEQALERVAEELRRLGAGSEHSLPLAGEQVFGGSYGWSSAGRFHHAQGQLHRFLNSIFGGYVRSVDTYSSGAGAVILDLVWGNAARLGREQNLWREIAEQGETVLAFGGLPLRNLAVSPGGISQHQARDCLHEAAERGCRLISISPLDDDLPASLPGVERIRLRPASDVALMLGMASWLHRNGRVDLAYLERHTVGYERFLRYLEGEDDGTPKTADWASDICGVPAGVIEELAERAASTRTHISVAYGLQRSRHGEQPVWMALTLAAMLGQWPLPAGGFSYSLGSIGATGKPPLAVPLPTLPQGKNGVESFIPVARIAELLLRPGEPFSYKGEHHQYADIRLVYWAGGNPFHHHQDLTRLSEAFTRPETVIVHDSVGTATTRHADIVLPVSLTAEREDIGAAGNDPFLIPMQPLVPRHEGSKHDFEIFAALAERLGCHEAFTEGRDMRQWLAHMYERTETALKEHGQTPPGLDEFLSGEPMALPISTQASFMQRFHDDPVANPLPTPSGRIELASDRVAASGLPAHPAWIEPDEWLGGRLAERHAFQLVANQPAGKLHSQLDFGPVSMAMKQDGRERARLNAEDAERLGIATGDVIRLFNDRGGLLAAALTDPGVAPGIIQISTGSWYAPMSLPGVGLTCVNGNPNAVTSDCGASDLSQGCAGQLCLVSVERWQGEVPPVVPHERILPRPDS